MPYIPHSRVLGSLPPDQVVLALLVLCAFVVIGTGFAYARCRRQQCEFDRHLRQVLRRG
jgi:hypothetical protein